MAFWHGVIVMLWLCGIVILWHCSIVALFNGNSTIDIYCTVQISGNTYPLKYFVEIFSQSISQQC